MKKQVIFIYDNYSGKLIKIADVRSLSDKDFVHFNEEAKTNLKAKIEKEREIKEQEEKKHQEQIKELQDQITELRAVVKHLLGWEEQSDEMLAHLLRVEEEENND